MAVPTKQSKPVLASLLELAYSISAWGSYPTTTKRITLACMGLGIIFASSLLIAYFGLWMAWVTLIISIIGLAIFGISAAVARSGKDE